MKRIKDVIVAVCFLLLMLLIAMKFMAGQGDAAFRGDARVVDGDTLVIDDVRLRMAGIDAPETHQTCKTGTADWLCGKAAAEHLEWMIGRQTVDCVSVKRDKYRRPLVRCKAGDIDLNHDMVASGMAVAYGDFEAEEAAAKAARLGLWESEFERPEDWRRRMKLDDGAGSPGQGGGKAGLLDWFGSWFGS